MKTNRRVLITALLLLTYIFSLTTAASANRLVSLPQQLPAQTGGPSISSDQADYTAGSLVTLTGAGWGAGESVHVFVNDDQFQSWSYSTDVTADGSGGFTVQFSLPLWFVAQYSVTATGSSNAVATTSFTDAAGANIDQCANGDFNSTDTDCPHGTPADGDWQNGDLQSNNSHYREGDSVPFRI